MIKQPVFSLQFDNFHNSYPVSFVTKKFSQNPSFFDGISGAKVPFIIIIWGNINGKVYKLVYDIAEQVSWYQTLLKGTTNLIIT
jgi:hypothetical protein